MRPFLIHIFILTSFIILGIALFTMEALSPQSSGWLIKKFTFTKLYWLAFIGYSLASTFIVLSVGLFHKIRKKTFTKKAVILSHVIPLGLLWIFISLGFHDLIQDSWKNRTKKFKHHPQQVQIEQTEKKRPPIPAAPLKKSLNYKASGKPVEPDKQKSE
ncbi:MAG: hypothetical protein JSW26_08760 [Desulfobacterales bacterium]|nr:MAG: hypothetical protein JSW26_08760 [Desulfobacterales bacterium]